MNFGCYLALLCLPALSAYAQTTDCKALGFSGKPLCADCDKLLEIVKDTGLHEECRSCCEEANSESSTAKFEKAVLEVCKHRLREFPQVEGFITNKVSLYDNVQISHKWGAWPRLILKGTGKQKETIRIDSWTTDNIVEYLERKSIVMRAAQT